MERIKEITAFETYLIENEKALATVKKYMREISELYCFLAGRALNKLHLLEYREFLKNQNKARTVNSKLSAINAYMDFAGCPENRLKFLKVQRQVFIEEEKKLTEVEYSRLLNAARCKRNERLYMIMQTICCTGIRVSELKFITIEAMETGRAEISLKGKNRIIILQKKLRKKLQEYAQKQKISKGCIFCTRTGKPVDRSNIYHEMKKLCTTANVEQSKVFPHNLRRLFARTFYAVEKNLANLADILGHSSVETTRIYIASSISEYERVMNRMRLII